MNLLFATTNQNKLTEIKKKLGTDYQIEDLISINYLGDLPETHDTIVENAKEKAMFIYEHYGRICFADDSGLIIDALDGEPGVNSAHYCGSRDNLKNIEKVLSKMKGVTDRSARFITVIALVMDYSIYTFQGEVEGEILSEPIGEGGFGYDSIFRPIGFQKSFAEMTLDEKISLSHRSRATDQLVEFLAAFNKF